jgi:hypothetical protein
MTGVPHAVLSTELWRFDTSTREWEGFQTNTVDNGAAPSVRAGHVMTSVGLDLWVHGGDSEHGSISSNVHRCSTHAVPLLLHRDSYCISLYLVTAAAVQCC